VRSILSCAVTSRTEVCIRTKDEALLKKKSDAHVLEPLDTRMLHVREFCQRFKPSLEYDIVPISDIYGPTAWDPNIQALVLSDETREGAGAGKLSVSVNMTNVAIDNCVILQWPSCEQNGTSRHLNHS
jgi:phosphopantetheine adenylyltransferase